MKGQNEPRSGAIGGPWMWLMFAISSIAMVWPLWVSELLPFQDLPQHLAAVRTIHSLDDPAWQLSRYHVVDLSRTQYLSWYLVLDWMTAVMPLESACRILLSLYVVSMPLSCYALLRSLHLDPTAALLAAPLGLNTYLYMGFANYVSALPMVLLALALLIRSFRRWSLAEAIGLACLSVLLFYSHVQALLMYVGFAGVTLLLWAPSWRPRRWLRQMAHLVPTLGLLGQWMYRSRILATGKAWAEGHGGRNTTEAKFHFEPVMDRFKAIPGQLLEAFPDDSDDHLLLAWVAALCLVALLSVRGTAKGDAYQQGIEPNQRFRAMLRERIGAVWLVAGFGVYLVSPLSYKWIWPISHRLIPLLALIAVIAVAGRRLMISRLWVAPCLVAMSLWASTIHCEHVRDFDVEAGQIRQVLDKAERGRKLVGLMYERHSAVVNGAPYLHFAQYYVIDRGGMANFSFANMPQSPVLYPTVGGPPTLRARWEWLPHLFDWQREGRYYDYVLIRGGRRDLRKTLSKSKGELTEVISKGRWHLCKKAVATPN